MEREMMGETLQEASGSQIVNRRRQDRPCTNGHNRATSRQMPLDKSTQDLENGRWWQIRTDGEGVLPPNSSPLGPGTWQGALYLQHSPQGRR